MIIEILQNLFSRDLNKLKVEISSYKTESNIWSVDKNISNSAGNLCLHLIGNLNTYVGAALGNTGYIRNRELEFSLKDISQKELINKIEETIAVVNKSVSELSEEKLKDDFPLLVFENKTSTEFMLIHLATHLAYHFGQINYHRRLLDN